MKYNENGYQVGCKATIDDDELGEVSLLVYYRTWTPETNDIEHVYYTEDTQEKEDLCDWIDDNYPKWWLDIVDAVDAASVDFWR